MCVPSPMNFPWNTFAHDWRRVWGELYHVVEEFVGFSQGIQELYGFVTEGGVLRDVWLGDDTRCNELPCLAEVLANLANWGCDPRVRAWSVLFPCNPWKAAPNRKGNYTFDA